MMDVDDGYILWTGIWKGDSPFILWDDSVHDCMIDCLVVLGSLREFERFAFLRF